MATVTVLTTVSSISIILSLQEARSLKDFFGELDLTSAPTVVREVIRKFRKAIEGETFTTPVD